MKKSVLIEKSTTPEGGEISLYERDGDYTIRVDGLDLMSTRKNYSEMVLAEVVCGGYSGKDISVLVGGLGFGYTLKAVLENVSLGSKVVVSELMECVVSWNKDEAHGLAYRELADKRVSVITGDVGKVLRGGMKFDAILLDVDNGPDAFTVESNRKLYSKKGLSEIKGALNRGGTVGVWSASESESFEKLMKRCGFKVEVVESRARKGKGSRHYLYIGRL